MGLFTKDFIIVSLRYSLDWVIIIGFSIAATLLGKVDGARRPFNPYDQAFSFPYHADTVSVIMMGVVSIAAPALIIVAACLLAPKSALPALANYPHAPPALVWKHKLLNWNRAWLGLCLTDGLAFFVSNTLKNVIGKPRPHMITVCAPDWDKVAEIVKTTRTGPAGILAWNPIVTTDICTTTDNTKLSEAFRSFPSGHATMAFAGLTYMSLFFYSTLVLTLTKTSISKHQSFNSFDHASKRDDSPDGRHRASNLHPPSLPLASFVVVIFFFCLAMWIGCTRYLDFKHAGVDIFAGAALGFLSAICGTWWYAMPAAGGVAKGRIRAGYRQQEERGRVGSIPLSQLSDIHEPRGPIAAGERISMGDHNDRYSIDHHSQPPPFPATAVGGRKPEVSSVV